jgi:hypothetical protein
MKTGNGNDPLIIVNASFTTFPVCAAPEGQKADWSFYCQQYGRLGAWTANSCGEQMPVDNQKSGTTIRRGRSAAGANGFVTMAAKATRKILRRDQSLPDFRGSRAC